MGTPVLYVGRKLRNFTAPVTEPQSSLYDRAKKNKLTRALLLEAFERFALFRCTVSFASTLPASALIDSGHDGKVGSSTSRFSSGARPFGKGGRIGMCLAFPSPHE